MTWKVIYLNIRLTERKWHVRKNIRKWTGAREAITGLEALESETLKNYRGIEITKCFGAMDYYGTAKEKLEDVDCKRENVDLDDFEEFMRKVEEVNRMVHALTSNNKSEVEEATQNAAVWLKAHKKEKSKKDLVEEVINEPCEYFKGKRQNYDRTVINEKSFVEKKQEQDLNNLNCETMSQDAFMKSVEEDAKKRSEDRKERKIKSDALKEKAKKAFLMKDYEKALDWYNKAINVRKDSYILYTNRALTLLYLGLNSRALSDCETALKLDEKCFKAMVYKGKAYFQMGEEEKAEKWMTEAKKMFPDRKQDMEEYQKTWNDSPNNEEN